MPEGPVNTYYSGIVREGPAKGKTLVSSRHKFTGDPAYKGGFYLHVERRGPEPAYWRWVPTKENGNG